MSLSDSQSITLHGEQFKKLFDESDIQSFVRRVAEQLDRKCLEKPVLVCVLHGALYFLADLSRTLQFPHEISSIRATSYKGEMKSSGDVSISSINEEWANRNIVLVDDVFDTGNTLIKLIQALERVKPSSMTICCLLSKRPLVTEISGVPVLFGKEISNEFVVGYGLDYAEDGRYLREIFQRIG